MPDIFIIEDEEHASPFYVDNSLYMRLAEKEAKVARYHKRIYQATRQFEQNGKNNQNQRPRNPT